MELDGKTIGFMRGTISEEKFLERYADISIHNVEVGSFSEAASLLREGVIDGFVIDEVTDLQFDVYGDIRSDELDRPMYTYVSIATANPEIESVISVINNILLPAVFRGCMSFTKRQSRILEI